MTNQIKVQEVESLHEKFVKAKGAVLADYCGMTVSRISELRNELRGASIEFKIVKNTLARRAAKDTSLEPIIEKFIGPTSIALTYDDVVASAKIMTSFAKKDENLKVRAGVIEGKLVTASELETIALLPPKEVLLGKILGTLNAPLTNFVGLLGAIPRQFLQVLNAINEKKGGS